MTAKEFVKAVKEEKQNARVICKYCHEGKDYKAVSDCYVLTPFLQIEDLCANVYVEKNNPAKYSVELLQTD